MQLFRTLLLLSLAVVLSSGVGLAQEVQKYQIVKTSDGRYFVSLPGIGKIADSKVVGPKSCSLEDCQKWIKETWTDMRPLSLQKRMEADGLSVDDTKLRVVINHEEQYSVALASEKVPEGWRDTGRFCTLNDCMKYIEKVWTDMRPLSLRKRPGRAK